VTSLEPRRLISMAPAWGVACRQGGGGRAAWGRARKEGWGLTMNPERRPEDGVVEEAPEVPGLDLLRARRGGELGGRFSAGWRARQTG
jgi:hypothetical protein